MTLAFLDTLAAQSREPSTAAQPSAFPASLIRRLWTALGRRRWRRAAPFLQMSDHLRRDVGLPPLDDRGPCR